MTPRISLYPSRDPVMRNATRLLSMIHELHKAGYQRVRFSSGLAPSGMDWRCLITNAGNMTADGLSIRHDGRGDAVAAYTTGSQDRYFGWSDAPERSARELAVLFIQRFPVIVREGEGHDWPYAGWLTAVLGRAERGEAKALPVFFADYPLDPDPTWLPPPP